MTFARPFSEWKGMFAGNTMLLLKSVTQDPEAFNKGQLKGPGPSAGPFQVSSLDRTAQRITLRAGYRVSGLAHAHGPGHLHAPSADLALPAAGVATQ